MSVELPTTSETVPVTQATSETVPVTQATNVTSDDALVDSLIHDLACCEQITSINVLSICISLMQLVERSPNMNGEQKKALVVRALTKILTSQNGDLSLLNIIPSYIDKVVSLNNGEIVINVEKMVECCFGLFSRKA